MIERGSRWVNGRGTMLRVACGEGKREEEGERGEKRKTQNPPKLITIIDIVNKGLRRTTGLSDDVPLILRGGGVWEFASLGPG